MRRIAFLLRPSWVILAALVVAFAYLCFTVLAPWQLGKNTSTSHRNQLIADSVRADPVDITTMLDDADNGTEWRRVTATGSFVPNSTVLVRLRHLDGAPGYSVLTAFALTDGRVLLVDRGLVAGVDGGSRPPAIPDPPAGSQRVEGRVRASEGVTPGREPVTEDGFRQVYSIDTTQEAGVIGLPLTPIPAGDRSGYLQLSQDQPGAFSPRRCRNSTPDRTCPTGCSGSRSASWRPSASATSCTRRSGSGARRSPPPNGSPPGRPPPNRSNPNRWCREIAWPTVTDAPGPESGQRRPAASA